MLNFDSGLLNSLKNPNSVSFWVLKLYYNSEDRISTYVGMEHNGLELGLVTGYESEDILPMIRYKKNSWFIAPGYEVDGTYGVVVGLEFKLK